LVSVHRRFARTLLRLTWLPFGVSSFQDGKVLVDGEWFDGEKCPKRVGVVILRVSGVRNGEEVQGSLWNGAGNIETATAHDAFFSSKVRTLWIPICSGFDEQYMHKNSDSREPPCTS